MEKSKRIQSHGLTHEQLKDLQFDQQFGDQEKVKANKNGDYEINANEKHLVHVTIETKTYREGVKTSVPTVQCFYPMEFARMENDGAFLGKSVEIIHQPTAQDIPGSREAKESRDSNTSTTKTEKVSDGLDKLNKTDLQAKYKEVFGVEDSNKLSGPKLLIAIREKLAETPAKPLEQWSYEDLRVKYAELWEEEAEPEASPEELIAAIKAKIEDAE